MRITTGLFFATTLGCASLSSGRRAEAASPPALCSATYSIFNGMVCVARDQRVYVYTGGRWYVGRTIFVPRAVVGEEVLTWNGYYRGPWSSGRNASRVVPVFPESPREEARRDCTGLGAEGTIGRGTNWGC